MITSVLYPFANKTRGNRNFFQLLSFHIPAKRFPLPSFLSHSSSLFSFPLAGNRGDRREGPRTGNAVFWCLSLLLFFLFPSAARPQSAPSLSSPSSSALPANFDSVH